MSNKSIVDTEREEKQNANTPLQEESHAEQCSPTK
jgi:hypothetical protein